MSGYIKTKKNWKKHLPQKPRRVQRGYYDQRDDKYRKRIIKIIWIILIILLAQSIFQIKYFEIDKINLSGNKDLTLEEVEQTISDDLSQSKFLLFKHSNYWLFDPESIKDELSDKFNLEKVDISKEFPDTLNIVVLERVSRFIWQKDDTLYLIDSKGVLNRQIKASDKPDYLMLEDRRDFRPLGDQIFEKEEIDTLNKIYLGWEEIIGKKMGLEKIVILNGFELELFSDIGFYIKIDTNEDMSVQLNNLNKVLMAENFSGLDIDYIDIRFEDRVYFK